MLPWFFKPKGINVILDPKNKVGNIYLFTPILLLQI